MPFPQSAVLLANPVPTDSWQCSKMVWHLALVLHFPWKSTSWVCIVLSFFLKRVLVMQWRWKRHKLYTDKKNRGGKWNTNRRKKINCYL